MNGLNKDILKIALPAIATNITVPLLSMTDMAIAGHLGNETHICAISIGGTLLNLLYWNFGFLRMGTSGITAQAFGAKNESEMVNTLLRSLFVSLCAGIIIFLLKNIIQGAAFRYIGTTSEVELSAETYMDICILGVPATMCLYSMKGWFIGMQNSVYPMVIALSTNVFNIILSLVFVFVYKLGISGIAYGTVTAEYFGLTLALLLWWKRYNHLSVYVCRSAIFNARQMKRFCTLNGGIAIRTLCLTCVTCFFTLAGAKQGTVLLAVNTLLMQLFTLFSYFTDGFAYAGEALVGKYIGANNELSTRQSIHTLFAWGLGLALLFSLLYAFFTPNFLRLLTNDDGVLLAAVDYHLWVIAIPICGFSAFIWDGIMVGATMAKGMATTMVVATTLFFVMYNLMSAPLGNHGLWLAFIIYLCGRGVSQAIYYKRASNKIQGSSIL